MPGRCLRHLVFAPSLAAVVIGLAACGQEAPPARADGLAVARYQATGSGGDGAALSGVAGGLDGCLVVRPDSNPENFYVPVFASNDDTPTTITDGERVELGGGEGVPPVPDDWPEACPSEGPFWIVVQP